MSREKFSLILQDAKEIAPLVRHFTFVRKDGAAFDFIPGQFINLFFDSLMRIPELLRLTRHSSQFKVP